MRSELTDITVLLDRTGSMSSIKEDVIGGFNDFVAQQQQAKSEAVLSLVQFDSQDPNERVFDALPVDDVPPLTDKTYVPRATTPLLDALGHSIVATGQRLAAMPEAERPGKVIFVVITDGLENASSEYSRKQVVEMIEHQREVYDWQFVFLAAEQDAIAEGLGYGIDPRMSLRYGKTGRGARLAMAHCGMKVARYRSSGEADELHHTAEDRRAQEPEIAKGG